MKICQTCNTYAVDSERVCGACGGQLARAVAEEPPTSDASLGRPMKSSKWAGYVLVLMVVLGMIWYVLPKSEPTTPAVPREVASSIEEPAPRPAVDAKPIPHKEAASYTKDGKRWRIVVVGQGLSNSDLITLARQHRKDHPNESLEIFDDQSGVAAYTAWSLGKGDYPEKWVDRHDVGMVNMMLNSDGPPTWQLRAGAAHPTPYQKLVDLP